MGHDDDAANLNFHLDLQQWEKRIQKKETGGFQMANQQENTRERAYGGVSLVCSPSCRRDSGNGAAVTRRNDVGSKHVPQENQTK